jgi:hypothetical protein
MNGEFSLVRSTARASQLGRVFQATRDVVIASWRGSRVGVSVQRSIEQFNDTPLADRIRWVGVAVAVASIGHLGLRALQSSTVVAALPALLFAGAAALGALLAWQAGAFARAWHQR